MKIYELYYNCGVSKTYRLTKKCYISVYDYYSVSYSTNQFVMGQKMENELIYNSCVI